MDSIPEPPPLTRLERHARTLDLPAGWSIDERANWFRAYLRREIARRLREEAGFAESRVPVVCSECGGVFSISERSRRRNGSTPRCETCRVDERIRDLAGAVEALR